MNWSNVKSLAIPVGGTARDVKRVSIGGAVVWEKPSPLPYDAEVEYLESTGTQYINTGVYATENTKAVLTCKMTANFADNSVLSMDAGTFQTRAFNIEFYSSRLQFNFNNKSTNFANPPISQVMQISASQEGFIVNGTTVAVQQVNQFVCEYPLLMFCYGRNGAPSIYGKWAVYSCQIYQNNTLVRDFIPVRVGTTGYLYDRVSGQLFGNAGTGDFVLGPDVVPVEYLQGDGNAYIDTPIVFNSATDTVRADFELLSRTKYKWCFGSHDPNARCAVGSGDGENVRNIAYGTTTVKVLDSYFVNTRCLYVANQNGVYLGANRVCNFVDFAATTPMRLFGLHLPNDSGTYASQTRFWNFAVTRSGSSFANYKSVRVGSGSTWEGAMIDTLTRRIYRNQGTGAFGYGADLPLETLAN